MNTVTRWRLSHVDGRASLMESGFQFPTATPLCIQTGPEYVFASDYEAVCETLKKAQNALELLKGELDAYKAMPESWR